MNITINGLLTVFWVSLVFSGLFTLTFIGLKAYEGRAKINNKKCWVDIWADLFMITAISAFRVSIVFISTICLLYLGFAIGDIKFVENGLFEINLLDIFHMKNTLIVLVLAWILKTPFDVLVLITKNANWLKKCKQKIENKIKSGTLVISVDELTDEIKKDLEEVKSL